MLPKWHQLVPMSENQKQQQIATIGLRDFQVYSVNWTIKHTESRGMNHFVLSGFCIKKKKKKKSLLRGCLCIFLSCVTSNSILTSHLSCGGNHLYFFTALIKGYYTPNLKLACFVCSKLSTLFWKILETLRFLCLNVRKFSLVAICAVI